MDIYEIPTFVHDTTCDKIVGEIPITPTIPDDKVFPFYAGRSRYVESFPSCDVLTDIIDRIKNKAFETFGHKVGLTYTDVVSWYPGQRMLPHCDTVNLFTGNPHFHPGTEIRDYTAILYLNDDFEGGKIFFPELLVSIEPEKGKLVLFPSNIDYVHGITEIRSGVRHSFPMWFHIIRDTSIV